MDDSPCCTDTGDGTLGYLTVKGVKVGIKDLFWILHKVRELDLADNDQIMEELIQKVESRSYVPSSSRKHYAQALLDLYREKYPG